MSDRGRITAAEVYAWRAELDALATVALEQKDGEQARRAFAQALSKRIEKVADGMFERYLDVSAAERHEAEIPPRSHPARDTEPVPFIVPSPEESGPVDEPVPVLLAAALVSLLPDGGDDPEPTAHVIYDRR